MTNPTDNPTPAPVKGDALPKIREAVAPLHHLGRDLKNNVATALHYLEHDLTSAYGDRRADAERALPGTLAAIERDAKAIAAALPALRALTKGDAPADIDDRARSLTRLGMTIRVRYVCPTNTKGGRYVAEVCGDDDAARVYVSSQLHNRDEATRLEAAERCLAKWHANRVAWWKANVGKAWELPLPVIQSVGSTGDAWLFFTK